MCIIYWTNVSQTAFLEILFDALLSNTQANTQQEVLDLKQIFDNFESYGNMK